VLHQVKQALAGHMREQFSLYLLVMLIFTAGVVFGALSVRLMGEAQIRELNDYFFSFVDFLVEGQHLDQGLVLQRSLLQNGMFMLVLWLSGTVFFGSLFALGSVFYRGFTIGFTVGFLAEQTAMQGVVFAMAAILPQNLIYVPVTLVAAVMSVSLSAMLFRRRTHRKDFPFGSYFLQYTLAMLIAVLALVAGSLVEAAITPVFMRAVASLLL
jgi:stage II sporulation protein M